MEALFNAQTGMAFGVIAVLLVVLVAVLGWTRRMGNATPTTRQAGTQPGATGSAGLAGPAGTQPKADANRPTERKKKQFLIQGKDAEIAASVLRRMLSDHDRS